MKPSSEKYPGDKEKIPSKVDSERDGFAKIDDVGDIKASIVLRRKVELRRKIMAEKKQIDEGAEFQVNLKRPEAPAKHQQVRHVGRSSASNEVITVVRSDKKDKECAKMPAKVDGNIQAKRGSAVSFAAMYTSTSGTENDEESPSGKLSTMELMSNAIGSKHDEDEEHAKVPGRSSTMKIVRKVIDSDNKEEEEEDTRMFTKFDGNIEAKRESTVSVATRGATATANKEEAQIRKSFATKEVIINLIDSGDEEDSDESDDEDEEDAKKPATVTGDVQRKHELTVAAKSTSGIENDKEAQMGRSSRIKIVRKVIDSDDDDNDEGTRMPTKFDRNIDAKRESTVSVATRGATATANKEEAQIRKSFATKEVIINLIDSDDEEDSDESDDVDNEDQKMPANVEGGIQGKHEPSASVAARDTSGTEIEYDTQINEAIRLSWKEANIKNDRHCSTSAYAKMPYTKNDKEAKRRRHSATNEAFNVINRNENDDSDAEDEEDQKMPASASVAAKSTSGTDIDCDTQIDEAVRLSWKETKIKNDRHCSISAYAKMPYTENDKEAKLRRHSATNEAFNVINRNENDDSDDMDEEDRKMPAKVEGGFQEKHELSAFVAARDTNGTEDEYGTQIDEAIRLSREEAKVKNDRHCRTSAYAKMSDPDYDKEAKFRTYSATNEAFNVINRDENDDSNDMDEEDRKMPAKVEGGIQEKHELSAFVAARDTNGTGDDFDAQINEAIRLSREEAKVKNDRHCSTSVYAKMPDPDNDKEAKFRTYSVTNEAFNEIDRDGNDDSDDEDEEDRKMPSKVDGGIQEKHEQSASVVVRDTNGTGDDFDAQINEAIRLSREEAKVKEDINEYATPIYCTVARVDFEKAVDKFVEKQGGYEKIEAGQLVRHGNTNDMKKERIADGGGTNQTGAQYGRFRMHSMWRVFDVLEGRANMHIEESKKSGIEKKKKRGRNCYLGGLHGSKITAFVDIGHGIGIQVLQAGWAHGVPSRGVEIMKDRHLIAEAIQDGVLEGLRKDPPDTTMVQLKLADFTLAVIPDKKTCKRDEELRKFLLFHDKSEEVQGGLVIFINNAQDVFAARSNQNANGGSLDSHLATLFANMQIGGRMVSLTDVSCHLTYSSEWFQHDVFQSGTNAVSWGNGNKSIDVHVLTKLKKEWFCQNNKCESKSLGGTTPVVDENGDLVESCVYCGVQARRCLRSRKPSAKRKKGE